jgi:two-component system nitrogen regulation response regulator NtrX
MSLPAQAKVLRAIQEQKIERVGGEKTISTNVRIVAASNKDLVSECEAGRFRQDLFFRLNVIPIRMPALRERPGDIPILLGHFLRELGLPDLVPDREAVKLLEAYPWPGNVRELRNLAERISVMYRDGERLSAGRAADLLSKTPEAFGGSGNAGERGERPEAKLPGGIMGMSLTGARESFEKFFLEYQLSRNCGIISKTAEAIGIYPSNLHAKLKKYKITVAGHGEREER